MFWEGVFGSEPGGWLERFQKWLIERRLAPDTAEKKKDIAAANGSAVVSAAHVPAYGLHDPPPTSRHHADRYADSPSVRLVPGFQSPEIMLRMSSKAWKTPAVAFRTLDGL